MNFSRYQIVQLYMAMGGVPHYLKEIRSGKSATQNINEICFSPNGLLSDEFSRLYPSLFASSENHIAIIRALANTWRGMTRKELVEKSGISEGGLATKVLEELQYSGFIDNYRPFGKKKKERLYRFTDEYSLFYLKFIEGNLAEGKDLWMLLSQSQTYKTWTGYAFESLCLKHIIPIKKALGIAGVLTFSSSFLKMGTTEEERAQIDLVIDRNDHVINLFELKFYNEEFVLSKEYAAQLRTKQGVFRNTTRTKKHLSWVFISPFGLKQNQHSLGFIDANLTLDMLFEMA